MKADDALGPGHARGDRRDQQRRRVGGEHGLGVRLAQAREQLALGLEALDDRLDDDVGAGDVAEPARRREVLVEPRRPAPALRAGGQLVAGALQAAGERVAVGVPQQRLLARHAAERGDQRAHRPGADDPQHQAPVGTGSGSGRSGTSALIPVSERPMISFWI